ncbi:MAG: ThuA domain-containing protein [Flavobacteriaceae bacterium]
MKRKIKLVLKIFFGLLFLLLIGFGAFIWKAKYGINFYDSTPPELPTEFSGKTVLLFSKTNGFRHGEAIEASIPIFEQMAKDNGWKLFATDNGAVFNPEQLEKFDVVIWNNTSGKTLDEEQRGFFKNYLEGGGGFVGIHAAGDNSHQWDWYEQNVLGALFSHHTLHPQFQTARMFLEEGDTTLTKDLLKTWDHREEWYMFFDNPRDKGFDVLYTVDETNMNPSGTIPILAPGKDWGMGKDHPIVWYHTLKGGRIFYSALGHAADTFQDPEHQKMLENAISWAGKFQE